MDIIKQSRYINPFTDFGFKRLFGEEPAKESLMDFLNALLFEKESRKITNITYLPTEQLPPNEGNRRAIFDIYCTDDKGEKFIIEMQRGEIKFIKDRLLYYASHIIQSQAPKPRKKGKKQQNIENSKPWDYKLLPIYAIGILDYIMSDDNTPADTYLRTIKLVDIHTQEVFYDKLAFIYLTMPKFNKSLDELENHFDKWLYVLKNLHHLDKVPGNLRDKIFRRFFEIAEISNLTDDEMRQYENSLKAERDNYNRTIFIREEGREMGRVEGREMGRVEGIEIGEKRGLKKGREEEKIAIAFQMLGDGTPHNTISRYTGLSKREIIELQKKL